MPEDGDAPQDNVQKTHNLQRGATPSETGIEGLKRVENPYYPAFDLLLAQLLAHEEVLKIVPRIIASDSEGATETGSLAMGPNPMSDQFDGFVAELHAVATFRPHKRQHVEPCNAARPSAKAAVLVKLVVLLPQRERGLLENIVGVVRIVDERQNEAIHDAIVLA